MKQKSFLLSAFLLGMATAALAQMPLRPYKSTVVNPDGTVTFQYRNDKAKKVSVDVQFAGNNEMHRDAKSGLWTVTLGPAAPDMYPYCFHVDGISIMDPQNDQYFPNEGFKNSLLEIPSGKESLPHDIKDVPHGMVEYVSYFSRSLGYTNNAIVYLPPSYYNNKEKTYPVFYLISGTTDTEEVYYKVGRVNYILDNLIAEGKAKDMIVVLPYGNPNKLLPFQPKEGMPATQFGNDVFSNDLVNDLMPFVESRYRTINDRDHRAIGGFSRGGNQGLSNGLRNLDKFSYLCSYSSFTSTDIPKVYDKAKKTNKLLHLFWLGVGTDDFLYGNARDYTEFLDKKGIRCVKEYTNDKFGHTWMNAKYFLSKTLPLLFNPEASEEAMRNAQPTLAKTGNEKQFTPGVMARLFPKQIVSPEYSHGSIIFRCSAPEAKSVMLESELDPMPLPMQRGDDGVWTLKMDHRMGRYFKYCFVIDGMKVADPNNMYLSPDKGFKYSLTKHTLSPALVNCPHGTVQYDLNDGTALYYPADERDSVAIKAVEAMKAKMGDGKMPEVPRFDAVSPGEKIYLIPGKDDTVESWFKNGNVKELLDMLIAKGLVAPCSLVVTRQVPLEGKVVRADDYSSWENRVLALLACMAGKQMALLNPDLFKTTIDGKEVGLYTIHKGNVTAQITNYGAYVCTLTSPDRSGNYTNLVTHYPNIGGYLNANLSQVGPSLGRFANRIANARFSLDGKEYDLTRNIGQHILHGGAKAFDRTVWDVVRSTADSLVLRCTLADGLDGFPGTLQTILTYSISDEGGLVIHYEAETDKPTVVNLSNHSYFNLNGAGNGDIMDHTLTVNATQITETDREGIPTGKLLDVEGTPYDFRSPVRIGDRQMEMKGFAFGRPFEVPEGKVMLYDNNFCLAHSPAPASLCDGVSTPVAPRSALSKAKKGKAKGKKAPAKSVATELFPLEKVATLRSNLSGRTIEVWSDQPGLQVYTGARTAIALESQRYPDSPNHPSFPSTVLRPGEKYVHTVEYRLCR